MLFRNFRGGTEKFFKFPKKARRSRPLAAIPAMLPSCYGFPYGNLRAVFRHDRKKTGAWPRKREPARRESLRTLHGELLKYNATLPPDATIMLEWHANLLQSKQIEYAIYCKANRLNERPAGARRAHPAPRGDDDATGHSSKHSRTDPQACPDISGGAGRAPDGRDTRPRAYSAAQETGAARPPDAPGFHLCRAH